MMIYINCPSCTSDKVAQVGIVRRYSRPANENWRTEFTARHMECLDCGSRFSREFNAQFRHVDAK